MKERFKFQHVNEITGTFVLVVAAILIAAVLWTGHSQRWFKSRVTLRINLPEVGAAGIRQGSEVYFLGTLVGAVSDVVVDTAGRMEAEASIRRDFFKFVRADSSAVVKRKFGVAGDAYFEISRGQGRPLPEKNAAIECRELPGTMETAIAEVRSAALPAFNKLNAGLDTWTALGTNLLATQEGLEELIARLNHVVAGVEQGEGTAGKLLTDPSIADDVKALVVQAHHSLDELQVTLNNLQSASGNLQIASTNLPAISDTLGHEARDLPGLVLQTQTSMREIERLVEAMQHMWLVRNHVNKTNPPPLNQQSQTAVPEIGPMKGLYSPRSSGN